MLRERQQIVIFIASAILIGGFMLLRYLPLRQQRESVRQSRTRQIFTIARGEVEAEQLTTLTEELRRLYEQVEDYDENIPVQRALGEFLGAVTELMNKHNLKERVVRPGEEVTTGEMTCIPVQMRCKGRLAQMFQFYRGLQALRRSIRVERVRMVNDGDFDGDVTMETEVVVYYRQAVEES